MILSIASGQISPAEHQIRECGASNAICEPATQWRTKKRTKNEEKQMNERKKNEQWQPISIKCTHHIFRFRWMLLNTCIVCRVWDPFRSKFIYLWQMIFLQLHIYLIAAIDFWLDLAWWRLLCHLRNNIIISHRERKFDEMFNGNRTIRLLECARVRLCDHWSWQFSASLNAITSGIYDVFNLTRMQ